jgi:hypothetical protein
MINTVNNIPTMSENTDSAKLNFTVDRAPAVSVLTKNAGNGKQGVINFDWLNIDDKVRKFLSKDGALDKILGPRKEYHFKSPSITKIEREEKIEEEKNHISKTITERTTYNTNQLKKAKVPERQIYKYLTYDGHVTFEGKRILKEHGLSYK